MPISSRRQQQHTPRSRCSFPVLPPASLHRAGGPFSRDSADQGGAAAPNFFLSLPGRSGIGILKKRCHHTVPLP